MVARDNPSTRVVLQRIRNRIIEYLETTASVERQRADRVSPGETINQWGDWVNPSWLPSYVPPVFTLPERDAILKFHAVWDEVASSVPREAVIVDDVAQSAPWQRLGEAAQAALAIFATRGKLPEDHEVSE